MISDSENNKIRKTVQTAFAAVCAVLCLLPFVGMLWAMTTTTTENRELADVPELMSDGTLNTEYLSDWGDWFDDHFAYRNELISLNAELRAGLLKTSATDNVIVGTDGWLYYSGTLPDYTGSTVLNGRAADNIAFNLSLMQGYVQANGADFIVTFAPNKNSLYDENMPYYYISGTVRSLEILESAMESYGINYISMYEIFSQQDEVLYYKRDTHWNTKGALLASVSLLEALGNNAAAELADLKAETVTDFTGDLNSMLYPVTANPENDYSYEASLEWSFLEGEDVEDSQITAQGSGTGTLLMYRDSFANNMIQFLANVYETSYFTKMVPYDLTLTANYEADTVIIERAERHLYDLGTDPAIMPAPSLSLEVSTDSAEGAVSSEALSITSDGDYIVVSGELPEEYQSEDVLIYVGLEKSDGTISWYVPFHLTTDTSDYGYEAYFYSSVWEQAEYIWLSVKTDAGSVCVGGTNAANLS